MKTTSLATSPTTGPVGDLFDTKQAAEFLTIAPRTLADWRAAKVIPVIERPGYVRFLRSDLEEFLQRHRVEARKAPPYRPRRKRCAVTDSGTTPDSTPPPATP